METKTDKSKELSCPPGCDVRWQVSLRSDSSTWKVVTAPTAWSAYTMASLFKDNTPAGFADVLCEQC